MDPTDGTVVADMIPDETALPSVMIGPPGPPITAGDVTGNGKEEVILVNVLLFSTPEVLLVAPAPEERWDSLVDMVDTLVRFEVDNVVDRVLDTDVRLVLRTALEIVEPVALTVNPPG